MTSACILVCGVFLANFLWFIVVLNTSYVDYVNPKFITNSYDANTNEELESILLKSLQKYVGKYFNKTVNKLSQISTQGKQRSDYDSHYADYTREQTINLSLINEDFKNYEDSQYSVQNMKLKNITNNNEIQNNSIPQVDEVSELLRNYQPLKISNSSKVSMFLDKDKKIIYIVKVSNEQKSPHRYDSNVGELSLYYIPVNNFIAESESSLGIGGAFKNFYERIENIESNTSSNSQSNAESKAKAKIENSLIKKCWSSKFFGRIIGAVSSSDKSALSIFYRIIKGPTVSYRIRFFHNISCDNFDIEKTDEDLIEKFNDYLKISKVSQSKSESQSRNLDEGVSESEMFFEISDSENPNSENFNNNNNNNNERNTRRTHFPNFFNDNSYDDFALKGNTPISALSIKKDTIAYARDMDYRQFYILKRESVANNKNNNQNKNKNNSLEYTRSWKVSLLGPPIDKTVHNFFHTNSLKFAEDNFSDYKLFHVYLTMNSSGIFTFGYVIKANHTDYINNNATEYSIRRVAKYSIESEVLDINNYEEFNIDKSIEKLRRFLKPTVFSNNNNINSSLLFEFKSGTVCLMGWSKKTNNEYFYNLTPEGEEKVSKISSDENNENIVIKFEKSKEMLYFFRYKEKQDSKSIYYDVTKNINLKTIPKKYRSKEIVSYFIENVNDKIVLFILNADGIVISLDFTKISKKSQVRNLFLYAIMYDLNYTASLIMFFNLISLVLYFRFYRRSHEVVDPTRGRSEEINQVIQDIIRLNNLQIALGGNLNAGQAGAGVLNNPNAIPNANPIPNLIPNVNAGVENINNNNNNNINSINENQNMPQEVINENVDQVNQNVMEEINIVDGTGNILHENTNNNPNPNTNNNPNPNTNINPNTNNNTDPNTNNNPNTNKQTETNTQNNIQIDNATSTSSEIINN